MLVIIMMSSIPLKSGTTAASKCQCQCQLSLSKIRQSKKEECKTRCEIVAYERRFVGLLPCCNELSGVRHCESTRRAAAKARARSRCLIAANAATTASGGFVYARHVTARGLRGAACSGVIQLAGPRLAPHSPTAPLTATLTATLCCRPSAPSPPPRPRQPWSRATTTSTEMVSARPSLAATGAARMGRLLWREGAAKRTAP